MSVGIEWPWPGRRYYLGDGLAPSGRAESESVWAKDRKLGQLARGKAVFGDIEWLILYPGL